MMLFKTCLNSGSKAAATTRLNHQLLLSGNATYRASVRGFAAAASSNSGFDAAMAAELPKFKISPAAGWWLRSYGVLPSQVPASGPKGYILKGDVVKHVKTNSLSLRPRDAFVPASQVQ